MEKDSDSRAKEIYYYAKALAISKEPGFVIDDSNKSAFEAMSLYFGSDQRFEDRGYGKLKKGLFLTGDIGTGKTLLMKVFGSIKNQKFTVISCSKLTDKYQKDGITPLKPYFDSRDPMSLYDNKFTGYCFDDLGVETSVVKYMGNELNVMERVIMYRYENEIPFHLTHFTSNLDADQIGKIYGARVRSRLREMCNLIEITGGDRRK